MIVVIQCAARKQHGAGHLCKLDGRDVMFVGRPDRAPHQTDRVYARPDDLSDRGLSWRKALQEYNDAPSGNPLGLLPAWQLYRNSTYEKLFGRFGPDRLYVLSAGWGLIRADYLTPNYDITFSKAPNVEQFKRRGQEDAYEDFILPSGVAEPIVFFGGRDYISLFCRLTENVKGDRTVFYAGSEITAPGCAMRRFGDPFTNWHYQCAKAFLEGALTVESG